MDEDNFLGTGLSLVENAIDNELFQTNSYLCTNSQIQGPFWTILQMSMALAALFAIIMTSIMAYKMMVKHEPLDVLKLVKPLLVSIILCFWYPVGDRSASFLDLYAYIPNCIGTYTKQMFTAEATNVNGYYEQVQDLVVVRDTMYQRYAATIEDLRQEQATAAANDYAILNSEAQNDWDQLKKMFHIQSLTSGITIALDKIILFLSVVLFKLGWWGTIFMQQILLGMLTIFGPIQWAFSLLPRWESAWAKWSVRYLTVHFYGAMLYFVGFYILLLYDIVLNVQIETLSACTASAEAMMSYISHSFITTGYLIVAGVVALKCLNLVPDLASWIIPDGETAMSARGFGEGVASSIRTTASTAVTRTTTALGKM